MIGALALRQIAEAIERAAKAEDLSTVRRLRELFDPEVRRVAEQAGSRGRIEVMLFRTARILRARSWDHERAGRARSGRISIPKETP